jgi:hypothetical protein
MGLLSKFYANSSSEQSSFYRWQEMRPEEFGAGGTWYNVSMTTVDIELLTVDVPLREEPPGVLSLVRAP